MECSLRMPFTSGDTIVTALVLLKFPGSQDQISQLDVQSSIDLTEANGNSNGHLESISTRAWSKPGDGGNSILTYVTNNVREDGFVLPRRLVGYKWVTAQREVTLKWDAVVRCVYPREQDRCALPGSGIWPQLAMVVYDRCRQYIHGQ